MLNPRQLLSRWQQGAISLRFSKSMRHLPTVVDTTLTPKPVTIAMSISVSVMMTVSGLGLYAAHADTATTTDTPKVSSSISSDSGSMASRHSNKRSSQSTTSTIAKVEVTKDDSAENEETSFIVDGIPQLVNINRLQREATEQSKPILWVFSQENCLFCETLKLDVIKPLLKSEAQSRTLVREIYREDRITYGEFTADTREHAIQTAINRYDINFYPTVVFTDSQGNEIGQRRLGYQRSNDFYWAYIEQGIEMAAAASQSE